MLKIDVRGTASRWKASQKSQYYKTYPPKMLLWHQANPEVSDKKRNKNTWKRNSPGFYREIIRNCPPGREASEFPTFEAQSAVVSDSQIYSTQIQSLIIIPFNLYRKAWKDNFNGSRSWWVSGFELIINNKFEFHNEFDHEIVSRKEHEFHDESKYQYKFEFED